MRRSWCLCLWLFIVGVTYITAQEGTSGGEQFVGTWSGKWEGAGTGDFELTLEKSKDAPVTGRVSVTAPTYKATLQNLSFDGRKLSAKYDFPPDESAEVVLAATFDGKKADGTWLVREKADGSEVARGTWTVTKQ